MDALGSYWYLEHISTGKKIILNSGENTLGRHSSCKLVLKDYDFLSRRHAIITINRGNDLQLQLLNALNGVFINGIKLTAKTIPLSAGDIIGLGVDVDNLSAAVPINYGIFVLKQMCPAVEDIVILSDDDGDVEILQNAEKPSISDEIKVERSEVKSADNSGDKSPIIASAPRTIHLPILPEVKHELLTQQSREIEDIFGEPNEELLESVYQINPYVYKQLNSNNIVTGSEQIHDGDLIELPEDTVVPEMPAPKVPPLPLIDLPEMPAPKVPPLPETENILIDDEDDDYDENMAMSQAVLREIKEELDDILFDLSDEENHNQFDNDFEPPAEFKTAIATELDDDEIIVIEDDDDDLYNKVAGWSSKLLSQNVMSQIYPLDEEDQLSDEDEVERQARKLFNDPTSTDDITDVFELPSSLKRSSTAMRIDSSASGDESALANHVVCSADSTTPTTSTSKDNLPTIATKESIVRKRSRTISDRSDLQKTNQREAEKSVPPKKQVEKETQPQKSTIRKRRQTVHSRTELEDNYKNIPDSVGDMKSSKTSPKVIFELEAETLEIINDNLTTTETKKKTTMRKRSKTISDRSDLQETYQREKLSPTKSVSSNKSIYKETEEKVVVVVTMSIPPKKPIKKETQEKSIRKRRQTIHSRTELEDKNRNLLKSEDEADNSSRKSTNIQPIKRTTSEVKTPKEKSKVIEPETATEKRVNPRLLKRSKSCYMERPLSPEISDEPSSPITTPTKTRTVSESTFSIKERSSSHLSEKSATPVKKYDENLREIPIIEPPHLPKNRGKLRGVSAVSKEKEKEKNRKNIVLEKQRMLNYHSEMKNKWYQKPKDKKRECEEIKQKRRDQLKTLATEKKPDPVVPDTLTKRTQTTVPTLGNCNRGEFLTKEIQPPTNKKPKLDIPKTSNLEVKMKRRATIESFSQQLNAADELLDLLPHTKRLPERKDAFAARNQRTCNRVTFADMDRDFALRQKRDKDLKRNRHVRFNDNVQIRIIERVEGADIKVGSIKDTAKFSLSTYDERREYSLQNRKQKNFSDIITGDILEWGNQWLSLRCADEVALTGVLVPIPTEFKSYKQYKDIMFPLMKIELLATIERDYKSSNSTFEVQLKSHSKADSRNRPRYVLVTRYNQKFLKKFDLYTLRSGNKLEETFASMPNIQRIAENMYELTFEILQKNISLDTLASLKTITVRPVMDNIKVEKGAFNAVHQLQRSPLFQRILKPSDNDLSCDNKTFKKNDYKGFQKLNENQQNICLSTWHRLVDDSSPSITLIQGPPGTGKSELIANLTLQCMYGSINRFLDRKILICAHSNTAVDNITATLNRTRKCMRHDHFELLRFGVFDRIDPKVHEVCLSKYLNDKCVEKRMHLTPENIESLKMQQEELKKEIAELSQRSHQLNYIHQLLQTKQRQLRLIRDQLNPPLTQREEWEYSRMFLKRANIVCTTLSSCVKLATFIDYFDSCIIDEATQCTEPWTLLPLSFGVKDLVLVGDTQQLPATVFSKKAIDCGLNNSMFDRIQRSLKQQTEKPSKHFVHTKVFKLTMQYRMHPDICKWPNSYFYENQLVNAEGTQRLHSPIIPYCVINLSYTRDTNDSSSRSISNDEEARFVAKLLTEMDKHMSTQKFKYGLITPYSNQCYALSQVIPSSMKIKPQTVDSYQGQQRDVIILSNARTRGVGFLTNYQRLNVAITRPRRCLIICGNFDDLQGVDLWRHLLNDARERQVYFDLKRNDVEELQLSLMSKLLSKSIEIE